MSKILLSLSYKNSCILKHALRNQIDEKKQWIQANSDGVENNDTDRKELEEEIKAFEAITKEIEWETRNWGK